MLWAVRPVVVGESVVTGDTILLVHNFSYDGLGSTALCARLLAFEYLGHFGISWRRKFHSKLFRHWAVLLKILYLKKCKRDVLFKSLSHTFKRN